MIRYLIVIFLVNYWTWLFSQELTFTNQFHAFSKNIPLEIINNDPRFFYLLRLNNNIHDMIVERRAKPSGAIVSVTPLKLDNVNKSWFDYENLDYLFFEDKGNVYFVFEKVLNTRKSLFLKVIDTTGKSTGFIELASIELGKNEFFGFEFKRSSRDKILIVASRTSVIGTTRKTIQLYDLNRRKMVWTKTPGPENSLTDRSSCFECNENNDLYYFKTRSQIATYGQLTFDTLFVMNWLANGSVPVGRSIELGKLVEIKTLFLLPSDSSIFLSIQGLEESSANQKEEEIIMNIKFSADLSKQIYSIISPYDRSIQKQLTFFDGPDSACVYKTHTLMANYQVKDHLYTLSQRVEDFYYKELLLRVTDLRTGGVVLQKIIPRKIMYFRNRLKYKQITQLMAGTTSEELRLYLLESRSNATISSENFNYHTYNKATDLPYSNIVEYTSGNKSALKKRVIFENSEFDLVPLRHSTDRGEMIFYFNNGSYEKFAILKLNPS
jgi:hypothetical protein